MMRIKETLYGIRKNNIPYIYIIECVCGYSKKILVKKYNKNTNYCVNCKKIKNHLKLVFTNMQNRCLNTTNKHYNYYGGRGIKILWNDFNEFYNDMYLSYKEGLTIERINVNGNYCKENCTWATKKEQNRNNNRNIKYNGKCISHICEEEGIKSDKVYHRIKRGREIKRALFT